MSEAVTIPSTHSAGHDFLDRLSIWTAWGIAGAVFYALGWMAMAPDDPYGPVSLLARRGAFLMWLQALALGCMVGVAATLIAGRRFADIGVFSAALGLSVVSLRGGTMEALILRASDPTSWSERHFGAALALEVCAWAVLLLLVMGLSGAVARWCLGANESEPDSRGSGATGFGLNGIPRMDGFRHSAIVLVASLVAYRVFSTGLYSRGITHGQACFLVAASVSAGVYAAMRFMPVATHRWAVLPALALGLFGCVIGGFGGVSADALPGIPPSHFLRVTPLQYTAVGIVGVIAMFRNMHPAVPGDTGASSARRRSS